MTRVEYVEASLRRPAQDAALQSVSADVATLRAAMNWADTRGDQLAALRIASAVPIGLIGERRQIIADLLVRVGDAADGWVAGVAYSALGELASHQGDWLVASEALTIAREHFVAAGSDRDAGWADHERCARRMGHGRLTGGRSAELQAIAVFRKEADTLGLGYALWVASLRTSDLDEAQRLAAEADELLRATGSPMGIAHNVEGRGIIAYDRDELADAAAFVAEAVELFARFGNPRVQRSRARGRRRHRRPKRPRRGRNRAPRRRRRTPSPQRRGPQAMGDPRTPRRHRRPHRAPLSPAAREAALSAGRQHTLESAARAALDALSTG